VAEHKFSETVTETTQVRAPWRATLRTVVWGAIAFAGLAPLILDAAADGGDVESLGGWAVAVLAVSGVITRIAALPGVEAFLRKYIPFLAAGATD
jgi:hypothetical protein